MLKYSWVTMLCQSDLQQSDSGIHIYAFLKNILSHYSLSQDVEYSSLYYILGPCCLSILNINRLHLPTPNSQSIPLPHSLLAARSLFSMSLFLFCR